MDKIEFEYYKNGMINKILQAWTIFWLGWWKGYILLIDIIAMPTIHESDKKNCTVQMNWVKMPKSSAIASGYKVAKGFNDNIMFLGVSQFARISNVEKFNVHVKDDCGRFIFSQDTACTLNDNMMSDNDAKFIKGLGKASLPKMDLQTMIMILIVGAGAIAGLYFMGVI